MDFLSFLTITLSAYLGILIITTLHELGHAIPMALFTKKKTTIYLGSYGEEAGNLKFTIWLIDFNVKYKLWAWKGGLCIPPQNNLSLNKQLFFLLAGPFTPTLFFGLIILIMNFFNSNGYLYAGIFIILNLSIIITIISLMPYKWTANSGKIYHTDGYQVRRLLKYRTSYNEYRNAIKLYNTKDYSGAALHFNNLLNKKIKDDSLYRLLIVSLISSKDYNRAKDISDVFLEKNKLTSDDYTNIGLLHIYLKSYAEAHIFLDKSLELNSKNVYALNNKAFAYMLQDKFEDSLLVLDQTLAINPNFIYSYLNRGYTKIKLGNPDEGLEDLKKAYALDPENSYYFKNIGHYHFIKEDYQKALDYFLEAKEKDVDTYNIDEDITMAENKLNIHTESL